VFFYVSEGTGFGAILFSGVVIMKKEKGKWKVVEKIESSELY
jgi:hypothetical protein